VSSSSILAWRQSDTSGRFEAFWSLVADCLTPGGVQLWATIEGVVDIPLQPSQTFWDRVAIYKQAYEAKHKVEQHFKANAKKGTLKVSIAAPVAVYRSPEKYRPELMKRWTERARALAAAAQAQAAPLDSPKK